jgi:ATP-dependent RNA helicase DDX52/ROK1
VTETITQDLRFTGTEDGKLHTMRQILTSGELKPPALIFVQSIERATDLFRQLVQEGVNVDVMHSERTKERRDQVMRDFSGGKTWVLICTDVMSRGVDFKGVNLVINYDFPQSVGLAGPFFSMNPYVYHVLTRSQRGNNRHRATFTE